MLNIELSDALETARTYADEEIKRLCNENKYTQAYVFQAIRDSLAQNIDLLQSYNTLYGKLKEENNNVKALEQELKTKERQAESDKFDAAFQEGYNNGYAQARFDYEQEPKMGHWIHADDDSAICGCCNRLNYVYGNYCKHCGAKMIESQESEVKE